MDDDVDGRITIQRATRHYRSKFGWRTRTADGSVLLPMTNGLTGVRVPLCWAPAVALRLRCWDTPGPVLSLPGGEPSWIFLAETEGVVLAGSEAPLGVEFLLGPREVALPPTCTSAGRVRWVQAPDPGHRWLPTLCSVRSAIKLVQRDLSTASRAHREVRRTA